MKTKLIVLAMILAVLFLAQGSAEPTNKRIGQFETGNDLYTLCKQYDYYSQGVCSGYIMGVHDLVAHLQKSVSSEDKQPLWRLNEVCGSGEVTSGQVRDEVTKYLRDHPETRDQSAAQLIIIALLASFPCDDQKQR